MTLSSANAIFANAGIGLWLGRLLLLLALMSGSALSFAWSEMGHLAITELAARELEPGVRGRLDKIAANLVSANPKLREIGERHSGISPLAQTAAWFDAQRGQSLEKIFARHGRQLPANLRVYAHATTDNWHYSNVLFRPSGEDVPCPDFDAGQLNHVLPLLADAFVAAEHEVDRALVLAMLVHLLADAHQPLHSVTRATGRCHHDRGGNGFCTQAAPGKGRCEESLHYLWDRGFGVFRHGDLNASVAAIAKAAPPIKPSRILLETAPWQAENRVLAEGIYATPEGDAPSAEYRTWARDVVRQRARMAAMRLAVVLDELVARQTPKSGAELGR